MAFVRKSDDKIIEKLKKHPLFEKLKSDIDKCEVFPAIRNNEIDFYYKGGRLFGFDSLGFVSNIKYSFVPNCNENGDINENFLKKDNLEHCKNFVEGYERIKEYCAKYNEECESEFVSRLFKKYSYINKKPKDNIVILDIEIMLTKSIRPDILLFDTKNQTLKFVEAKLYSNPELHNFRVVKQIEKYEKEIAKQEKNITDAYNYYIDKINGLFNTDLPKVLNLEKKVGLLYFDYDGPNKNSDVFKMLRNDLDKKLSKENKIYSIGDTKGGQKGASLKLLF